MKMSIVFLNDVYVPIRVIGPFNDEDSAITYLDNSGHDFKYSSYMFVPFSYNEAHVG